MLRDPMRGLHNRRFLEESVDTLISQAQRRKCSMAFMMLDIVYFKMVNDTYGHDAGDAVLKALAKLLKQSVRGSDFVIRCGGEEFLILLRRQIAPPPTRSPRKFVLPLPISRSRLQEGSCRRRSQSGFPIIRMTVTPSGRRSSSRMSRFIMPRSPDAIASSALPKLDGKPTRKNIEDPMVTFRTWHG